jgi:hypothetical protein
MTIREARAAVASASVALLAARSAGTDAGVRRSGPRLRWPLQKLMSPPIPRSRSTSSLATSVPPSPHATAAPPPHSTATSSLDPPALELLSAGSACHGTPLRQIRPPCSSSRSNPPADKLVLGEGEGQGRNETSRERETEKWWRRV